MLYWYIYRYNSSTGEFTVPSGGAGLYFLFIDFYVTGGEWARFDIEVNNAVVCMAEVNTDTTGSTGDQYPATCGALVLLREGMINRMICCF